MKNIIDINLNELKDVLDNYLAKGRLKLEKKRQQELFRIMREQKNGYYFYDMEYQQRYDSKVEQYKARENGESNKPDCRQYVSEKMERVCVIIQSVIWIAERERLSCYCTNIKLYGCRMRIRCRTCCKLTSKYVE